MSQLDTVLNAIDQNRDDALERLFSLLRIPSISTDSQYREDCARAAQWLTDDLASMGFSATLHRTPGHPMVVAHHKQAPGRPHLLFYGHYDVQPVDPLEEWNHPPFEPQLHEDQDGGSQILGRGSADDKGQLMTFVEACRAWINETGGLPCNVSVLFEGEEESGSPSLLPFLEAHREELTADLALVCDTSMWDPTTPAITTALRGNLTEEVTLRAANRDLHSGFYGSAAANPIHVLTDILARMRDGEGKILLDNFYDGVSEVPADILTQWQALGFSEEEFLGDIGLSIPAGEKGRSVLEQTWSRPTCEVNGIWGGYTGEGFKTVIPGVAHAKVSFRLVGQQDPDAIRTTFREFFTSRIPADCQVSFQSYGASPAVQLDYGLPQLKEAAGALEAEWGRKTAMIAMGGSIPIVGDFKTMLGMDSLLIGFGLNDDRIHSPNEKYQVSSFHQGARSWARVLLALAQ